MNKEAQGRRASGSGRRKNTRSANRKKQSTSTSTSNTNDNKEEQEQEQEKEKEITNENEQDSLVEQSDHEQEPVADMKQSSISPTHIDDDEEEPMILVKQRNKNKSVDKSPNLPAPKEEPIVPTKPQASVAPVKQTSSSPFMNNSSKNFKPSPYQQDNNFKFNGHVQSQQNIYTYSAYNPLPPRFQRQQKEAEFTAQKYRKRRGPMGSARASLPPGSAGRSNDFVPSSDQEQQLQYNQSYPQSESQSQLQYTNNDQSDSDGYHPPPPPSQQQQQQQSSFTNGHSSESDMLQDSAMMPEVNNPISLLLSTSSGSESSLQRLDLVRSLASSNGLLDQLISIFDTISFSADELDLILSKIANRHISSKNELQRFLSSTKSDKTFERILDETYRSQAKILAIELQTEKNRILELTKSNAEMENTIRQLQQQQQQQPNNMVQYQQVILSYQMQLQRLADENARLQHQLHAYSMMPATINELKQQHHILSEKIRQMTIRNSALENEVADSERASKHAAEIYKKADAQKQERIEQMIADINKYKKLDKELTSLRQKHAELEKNFNTRIDEVTHQRDDLQATCDQLKDKVQQYDQLKLQYDQLAQKQSNKPRNKLQEELNELKGQNDQLRQRNWKIMEELNKLLNDQQQNQDIK